MVEMMENPIFLMDDLGVPLFLGTPIPFSGANCLSVFSEGIDVL